MTLDKLVEAYLIDLSLERTRGYLARGRLLRGLSVETLNAQWVESYRDARAFENERREDELCDLRSEFDLRGIEPPMHLVADERAQFIERFRQKARDYKADPAEIDALEEKLADLETLLQGPKN